MELRRWIKSYGFYNVLMRGCYSLIPIIPVDNNELLRRMNWQLRVQKKLKKYLVISGDRDYAKTTPTNKIWWLWFQGSDKAPLIVKKCLETVKYYAPQMGFEVVTLDERNLFDYVKLPETIVHKWRNGSIGNASFSDLCRISLLADYGGLWLDSTVYLTGKIDQTILQSDLFVYQASFLDFSVTKISSWFMYARYKNNPYISSLRDSMINYWTRNNYIYDYFQFHLVAALLARSPQLKDRFNIIPFYSNTYPLLLGGKLMEQHNDDELSHIFRMSKVHKLSYKGLYEKPYDNVYNYLLNRPIGEIIDDR